MQRNCGLFLFIFHLYNFEDILNVLWRGMDYRREEIINMHTAESALMGIFVPDTITVFLEQDFTALLMSFVH